MKTFKKIFAFIMAVTLMLSVLPAQSTSAATSVTVSAVLLHGHGIRATHRRVISILLLPRPIYIMMQVLNELPCSVR